MNNQTVQTITEIDALVNEAVNNPLDEYRYLLILGAVACSIAAVVLSVIVALIAKKSAYLHVSTTPKKFHYTYIALLPISALYCTSNLQSLNIPLFAIACSLAMFGFWGLLRYKVYGIVSSVLYPWVLSVSMQLNMLTIAPTDLLEIEKFTSPGKLSTIYISNANQGLNLAARKRQTTAKRA
jgi:hypothetical protein